MMEKNDIGVYGLGVMGSNLALNLNSKGFGVSVYNRSLPGEENLVQSFLSGSAGKTEISGHQEAVEFIQSLKRPRVILLMVKAGAPVDSVIEQLLPLLEAGDIIVDGGNSHYKDTMRRQKKAVGHDLHYVGMGISGGEEGARQGPSMMPGGDEAAWPHIKDIFQTIAASADGNPCCRWMGPEGAGHVVKMVHNGIEYAIMQLLAESYHLLRSGHNMSNPQLAETFSSWNEGLLESYLMEITGDIFSVREDGDYVIDFILDKAGQKGTGRWTALTALELGVPLSMITAAVYSRSLSSFKQLRRQASAPFDSSPPGSIPPAPDVIRDALLAGTVMAYAEGFWLLKEAGKEYGWDVSPADVARVWREGCIIRSSLLELIAEAYDESDWPHLVMAPRLQEVLKANFNSWRTTVGQAARAGYPVPVFAAGLSQMEGLTRSWLPANLIQAQRDYFGAHTYRRTDHDQDESFHTDWQANKKV